MQGPILILKEGTDESHGIAQVISNINACQKLSESVRTTLGPLGMDKLIVDQRGDSIISNDGATILDNLNVAHPAAKLLVSIAKAQDDEIGDGTTTVVLLGTEIITKLKQYIESQVHARNIISALRKASFFVLNTINDLKVDVYNTLCDDMSKRTIYENCAKTSLSSKIISSNKDFFAKMAVEAILTTFSQPSMMNGGTRANKISPRSLTEMIGIKKIPGGGLEESVLVKGVAFKKTFSYAGFEMLPKKQNNPKIALLNIELELKSERENAEMRLGSTEDYQEVVEAEWKILYDKLKAIYDSGATVILSKLPIGDVAVQYFVDSGIFVAGRVPEDDLNRTMYACGGSILSSVTNISDKDLGRCDVFEEIQIGSERFNIFTGAPKARTCTIIIRGGTEQFMEETSRSLHDALMVVRRALVADSVVAGAGAIEMEISRRLREYALSVSGKEQVLMFAIAKAFEIIPQQLCDNAGFNSVALMSELRKKHASGEIWSGIDIENECTANMMEKSVFELASMKINACTSAFEFAVTVLNVDGTVKNPKVKRELPNEQYGH